MFRRPTALFSSGSFLLSEKTEYKPNGEKSPLSPCMLTYFALFKSLYLVRIVMQEIDSSIFLK